MPLLLKDPVRTLCSLARTTLAQIPTPLLMIMTSLLTFRTSNILTSTLPVRSYTGHILMQGAVGDALLINLHAVFADLYVTMLNSAVAIVRRAAVRMPAPTWPLKRFKLTFVARVKADVIPQTKVWAKATVTLVGIVSILKDLTDNL